MIGELQLKILNMLSVVLAGGQSSRMGRDKAFIEIHGQSLLHHQITMLSGFSRHIWLSIQSAGIAKYSAILDAYDDARVELLPDQEVSSEGPLAGLLAVLEHIQQMRSQSNDACKDAPWLAVSSCDVYGLQADIYQQLAAQLAASTNFDIACLAVAGRVQPLIAVIRLDFSAKDNIYQQLHNFFTRGGRSVMQWFDAVGYQAFDVHDMLSEASLAKMHFNINTEEDLLLLQQKLASSNASVR